MTSIKEREIPAILADDGTSLGLKKQNQAVPWWVLSDFAYSTE